MDATDDIAPSKRLQVLTAVKSMVQQALPGADVKGMATDDAKPEAVGVGGMVIVRSGDPGQPDVDLSPRLYNYEHAIPLEIAAYRTPNLSSQQVMDIMLSRIGRAIDADRTLGGLCDWIDSDAPADGESDTRGAVSIGWADFMIIASYSTSNPLT